MTGIPEIEEKARHIREHTINTTGYNSPTKSPFDSMFTKEEKIELTIRTLLQPAFKDLLSKRLPPDEIQTLGGVIFGAVYPLFFSRQSLQVEEKQENKEGGGCLVQ